MSACIRIRIYIDVLVFSCLYSCSCDRAYVCRWLDFSFYATVHNFAQNKKFHFIVNTKVIIMNDDYLFWILSMDQTEREIIGWIFLSYKCLMTRLAHCIIIIVCCDSYRMVPSKYLSDELDQNKSEARVNLILILLFSQMSIRLEPSQNSLTHTWTHITVHVSMPT